MATIGLDFGSSNSTLSWYNPVSGKVEAVFFEGDATVKVPSGIVAQNCGKCCQTLSNIARWSYMCLFTQNARRATIISHRYNSRGLNSFQIIFPV